MYYTCTIPYPTILYTMQYSYHTITYHSISYKPLYHTTLYRPNQPYNTIPYHTIPYHTVPYHTTPYHTIPYHTIPYHTIPYHTTLYHTVPYHTTPYHTSFHTQQITYRSQLKGMVRSYSANIWPLACLQIRSSSKSMLQLYVYSMYTCLIWCMCMCMCMCMCICMWRNPLEMKGVWNGKWYTMHTHSLQWKYTLRWAAGVGNTSRFLQKEYNEW